MVTAFRNALVTVFYLQGEYHVMIGKGCNSYVLWGWYL